MGIKETIQEKAIALKDDVLNQAVSLIDENGDGQIGLDDFVLKALKTKGIRINRANFLESALKKYCSKETIEKAIAETPAKAGVSKEIIRKAAKESIALQKTVATTTSLGLGYVPGGVAAEVVSTVADISQYYFHLLVIVQKLLYLYSYPEIDFDEGTGRIDDGTMNLIIICLGVMSGVKEAGKLLGKLTDLLAKGVAAKLINVSLTKKVVYKLIRKLLKWFSITLTKEIFAKAVSNMIKFAGGVLIGGITFVSFTKCCENFVAVLEEGDLWDPEFVMKHSAIDAEYTEERIEEELEKEIDLDSIELKEE